MAVESDIYFYQTFCGTKLSVVKSSDFLHFAAHIFIWQLWPKKKVREEILAKSQALEFLKSVKYKPSYGCLKLKSGFAILRSEILGDEFVKSSDYKLSLPEVLPGRGGSRSCQAVAMLARCNIVWNYDLSFARNKK